MGRASMFAEGGGHVVSVHLWERGTLSHGKKKRGKMVANVE